MLDDEYQDLLTRWSRQSRLRDEEVAAMIARATSVDTEPTAIADPAEPWITFWGQMGRLIRTQQQMAYLLLPQQSRLQ